MMCMSVSACVTPSRSYFWPSMWNSPAFATETLIGSTFPSVCGSGLKMPGRSSCTSCWSAGVTTMKMMRRTRTTSTSGVTFMSGVTSPLTRLRHQVALRFRAMLLHLTLVLVDFLFGPALDRVEELAGDAVQPGLVARDHRRQVVEREHGGDRDGEAECRLDERF